MHTHAHAHDMHMCMHMCMRMNMHMCVRRPPLVVLANYLSLLTYELSSG